MMVVICSDITLDGLLYCIIVLNKLEKVQRVWVILWDIYYIYDL